MKKIAFLPQAFNDYNNWVTDDKKIHAKIIELIKEIQRDPFVGKGKPEPLKHQLKGVVVKTNYRRTSASL